MVCVGVRSVATVRGWLCGGGGDKREKIYIKCVVCGRRGCEVSAGVGSGGGNFRVELIDKLIARTRVSIIINSFLIFSSFLLYSIDISTIFSTQSILIAFGVAISPFI